MNQNGYMKCIQAGNVNGSVQFCMPQQTVVNINIQASRFESEVGFVGIVQPHICRKGGVGKTARIDLHILHINIFRGYNFPAGSKNNCRGKA